MSTLYELEKHLAHFGLNANEAKIYLYLLNKPAQTILEVSRALSLPRTTVYNSTNNLIQLGLLTQIVKHKSSKVKAYPISILEEAINKQKTKVETLSQSLGYLKTNLPDDLKFSLATNTEVRYYNGKEGFQQMLWNRLAAKNETTGYSIYGIVEIVGKKYMANWAHEFTQKGIRDRVIINPTKRTLSIIKRDVKPAKHHNKYDDIRYIDTRTMKISGDTAIYNNVFAVAYWQEGEVVGVEIENEELIKTQQSIFNLLYSQAKPINKLLKEI